MRKLVYTTLGILLLQQPSFAADTPAQTDAKTTSSTAAKPNTAAPAKCDPALSLAMVDYNRGNYNGAIQKLTLLLAKDPVNVTARYMLGNAYVKIQRNREAVIEYQKCAELEPNGQLAPAAKAATKFLTDKLTKETVRATAKNNTASGTTKPSATAITAVTEITGLPPVPRFPNYNFKTSETFSMSIYDQGTYQREMQNRMELAKTDLRQAQAVLDKAKSVAFSYLPVKSEGESMQLFTDRKAAIEDKIIKALKPYQDVVDARYKDQRDAELAYTLCLDANKQKDGWYQGKEISP